MSHYANRAERLELIAGLIALAEFLEENEEVPAPKWTDLMVFPDEHNHDAARHEIDRIASLLGTTARESAAHHYRAVRKFGPVHYHAIAIPPKPEEEK